MEEKIIIPSSILASKRAKLHLELDINVVKLVPQFQCQDSFSTCPSSPASIENNYHQFIINYSKIQKIGEGMFSVVYQIEENETGRILAAKVTKTCEESFHWQIEQEFSVLSSLEHEGILKAEKLLKDANKGVFVLISEFVDWPQIRSFRGKIGIEWLRKVLFNLLKVLEYLHSKNFVHRDISSRNILASSLGEVKLIDFGQVEKIDNKKFVCATGVPKIAPPELLGNQKIDIWNAGMVALELMLGRSISMKKVKKTLFSLREQWGDECLEVLEKMLVKQEIRANADELLKMNFFTSALSKDQIIE